MGRPYSADRPCLAAGPVQVDASPGPAASALVRPGLYKPAVPDTFGSDYRPGPEQTRRFHSDYRKLQQLPSIRSRCYFRRPLQASPVHTGSPCDYRQPLPKGPVHTGSHSYFRQPLSIGHEHPAATATSGGPLSIGHVHTGSPCDYRQPLHHRDEQTSSSYRNAQPPSQPLPQIAATSEHPAATVTFGSRCQSGTYKPAATVTSGSRYQSGTYKPAAAAAAPKKTAETQPSQYRCNTDARRSRSDIGYKHS